MKTYLLLLGAISLATVNIHAAPLKVVKVNDPAINCLFSSNCKVTVNDTVADFTTNLPPNTPGGGPTNGILTGLLQSRTYAGEPGTAEAGLHAYEYRLVLKSLTAAQAVSITTMTLNFSPMATFTYQGKPNQQVWVITSGGLGSTGPASAATTGTQVTFHFNPPLKLVSTATQEASSYFFGMVSPTSPPAAANAWATFAGTEKTTGGATIPFNFLAVQARTP